MKFYHGTAERHLAAILKEGIKPRGKREGNWKHTIESNPDAVYLTDAYALYYAWQATNPDDKKDRLVVLEIDGDKLDDMWFAPDEDWLEQVSRKQHGKGLAPINKDMKYRTRWYRKRLWSHFHHHWKHSLEGLGNVTYHATVPVAAITRIAFIDQKTNADLVMLGMDPTISLMNYRFVGERYRANTQRLFDAEVEDADEFFANDEHKAARDDYRAKAFGKIKVQVLQ